MNIIVFSYLYNKGTTSGFIDTRLKTMRKSLPLNERKRRSCDNPQPKVRKLKHRMTTDDAAAAAAATGESPLHFDEADLEQKVTFFIPAEKGISQYDRNTYWNDNVVIAVNRKSFNHCDCLNFKKVMWLRENPTSVETETTIMEFMQDTFQYRKLQIDRELVNATMILQKYPRFIDFDNGRLVITSESFG